MIEFWFWSARRILDFWVIRRNWPPRGDFYVKLSGRTGTSETIRVCHQICAVQIAAELLPTVHFWHGYEQF